MASISSRRSSRTRRLTSTSVLAGRCSPKNSWRNGLIRGRCATSAPSRRLHGKVAVGTGSSGGIGQAIATAFAHEGAAVVVNSREASRAEEAASNLMAEGFSAFGFAADIRDPVQARSLASAAVERFGQLDLWVNNAGINLIKPALDLEPEEWADVIATNLSGCFYVAQAAARLMVPHA